ncbi:apolipoprotein N-acyltransferase [bacterium]|nr:apolipoprotein N-acyltransferase [bacterium]
MKKLSPESIDAIKKSWPAALGGLAYLLAFPTFNLWPLAFIAIAPTIGLVDRAATNKRAFWFAFVGGFVANAGKLYWLVYTINHYGHFPLPAALLVFGLLCATLGSFWGGAFVAGRFLVRSGNVPRFAAYALAWMFHEWWLTWFLTGFPWELLGHVFIAALPFAQIADVFGGIALSFPVIFGNALAYEIWRAWKGERAWPIAQAGVLAAMLAIMAGYGFWRMPQIDRLMAKGDVIRVGMLQGNTDQNAKWNADYRNDILRTYRVQATQVVSEGADLVLMPETALPNWQEQGRRFRSPLRRFLKDLDTHLLLAVPTRVENPEDRDWPYKYNSTVLVGPDGEIASDWYNKHRLVPFGEYLPLKKLSVPLVKWLRSWKALAGLRLSAGFYKGEEYIVFPHPKGRFGLAICYEIIYPGIVRTIAGMDTAFMATITNDAWFGDTTAPHQHWAQVQMRAIETRRWFARSANTGISGIVDANGRTISQTPTYVATTHIGEVTTMDTISPYLRIGDAFLYLCVAIFFALFVKTLLGSRRAPRSA